ncbi:MAG: single-stranded-DNA-specific exonuclease RecJ [Myxococcales bacterium]|nr:single-stranded-DNA-specific exonuclease RecJ [Myxococcales bacterium]
MSEHVQRRWVVHQVDDGAAVRLAERAGTSPLVARVLLARGLDDADDASRFLAARLGDMPDPGLMADIARAAERLLTAIRRREKVTIYGDYDVDGVTSSATLWLFCRDVLGVELDVYIPQRLTEGYGLNLEAIDHLADTGTRVLVTVDNGSSAIREVGHATARGLDVIVVDHHQVSDPEPAAFAHLNPHRSGCRFPDTGLAAVGVVFMLLVELRRQLRDAPWYDGPPPRPDHYLDLVALGTVADVAPLQGVNRALVRHGVGLLQRRPRLGLAALMDVSQVRPEALTARDLGFRLGPRINAAGRLADAAVGLRLLVGDDAGAARQLAALLEAQNQERRAIERRIADEAVARVEGDSTLLEGSALVLESPDWHPGVVGIVASRLVEKFHRPAILLARDGTSWKGSARSVPAVNIKRALDDCASHLQRYGGHVGAAGLALDEDSLLAFRAALNAAVSTQVEITGPPDLEADAEVALDQIGPADVAGLEALGPFGHANPAVRLVARGVRGRGRPLRGGHLKIDVFGTAGPCEAIGWGMEAALEQTRGPLDLLFSPRMETFRGTRRLVLDLKDLRPSEP